MRRFDGRLIGGDHSDVLIDLGLLLVNNLHGLEELGDQGAGPLEVLPCGNQLGFVLLPFCFGVVERRLIEPRVDLGQHVALADLVALLE
jgi:hypothetical protein